MFYLRSFHILTGTQHSQWGERCGGHTKVFVCKHFITTKLAYELKVRANLALLLLFLDEFLLTPSNSLYAICHRPWMWVVKGRNSQEDTEPASSNLHTTSSAARNRWTTTFVQFNLNCGSWRKSRRFYSILPIALGF
jgi:hypothetical protein